MSKFRISVLAVAGADESQNRKLIESLAAQKTGGERIQWIFIDTGEAGQTSESFAAAFSRFAQKSTPDVSRKSAPESDAAAADENVVYITPESGCSSVINGYNLASSRIEGEYALVLQAGDMFEPGYIRTLLRFADRVNAPKKAPKTKGSASPDTKLVRIKVPVIFPRHLFFDGAETVPDRFAGGRDVVGIDIRTSALTSLRFPMTLSGTLILTEALQGLTSRDILKPKEKDSAGTLPAPFDERLSRADAEKDALWRILLRYGLALSVGSLSYTYRTPQDGHFACLPAVYDRDWYLASLTGWLLPLLRQVRRDRQSVPAFMQAAALYLLRCRTEANRNNRHRRALSEADIDAFWKIAGQVLAFVDDEVIDRVLPEDTPDDFSEKVFWLGLKHNRFSPVSLSVLGEQLLLSLGEKPFASALQTPVAVQFMDARDGRLHIDGTIANVYGDEAVLQLRCGKEVFRPTYCERFALTKFFGRSVWKQKAFHISLPLSEAGAQSFHFEIAYKGHSYPLSILFDSHFSRLSNAVPHASWRFDGRVATYHALTGSVILRRNKPLSQIGRELGVWADILRSRDKRGLAMLAMRLLYWLSHPFLRHRRTWFFMDKIYKGGDNAEYIYRYAAEQKDGIRKRYLIDRHAPDATKLKRDGFRPVYRNTPAHYVNLLHADMLIASNSTVLELNHFSPATSAYIRDLISFHTVCVQHGLSVQRIAAAQNRLKDNTRLYFCASPVEIENLSRPIYDYEGYDALRLTGVPRFDGLHDRAKKQILLSPTWRMQAAVTVRKNEGVQRDYNPLFRESAYFKVYNELIHHPRLLAAAKKYGYSIAYVLHPIVSPQAKDFTPEPPVEIIPATGDMSYETIFCESALMVTDYSGVQFDFAYMRKPLLYFLPESLPKHYEEGAFSTEEMGFGPVIRDTEALVDALIDAMKNGCTMPPMYRERADAFFAFDDHDNCRRIYDELTVYQKKHIR